MHNHWAITLNALRSLVADDASTDATTQLGRQLPWLRIWRSEQNQGCLDTCNRGFPPEALLIQGPNWRESLVGNGLLSRNREVLLLLEHLYSSLEALR